VATAWLSRDLMLGGELTGATRPAGPDTIYHQFCPATLHWRVPGGEVGWAQLYAAPAGDAEAGKDSLAITAPAAGDFTFRASASGLAPGKFARDRWTLPGLAVRIETDAADFAATAGDGFIEVRYRRDDRFGGGAASVDWRKCRKLVRAAELFLLLSMVVPVPWLERVPTYKEQIDQLSDKDLSTVGFLSYPLLQTADVVMYNAKYVPVGDDQVPHLELSREVVRRFQNFYGPLFEEPLPLLTPTPRLPGLDNRKMSKSYGNAINLSDDAETVRKKVMQMYTDPKRIRADIPGTVEGNPVFIYHDAFNTDVAEVDDLKTRYRAGKVGDVEVKTKLAKALNAMLDPMRERRAEVLRDPNRLREIVMDGSRRARGIARETMERVRAAVRLKYE